MPFRPTPPPPAVGLLCFEFHWQTRPCFGEVVSGDELFLEDGRADGQVLLLLVDVMGHGPDAAAIVAHLRGVLLPDPACENLGPGQLLTVLNSLLAPVWDEEGRFVAAQAFLLRAGGEIVGSTAGNPNPRQRTPGPVCTTWQMVGDSFLGFMGGTVYAEDVLHLQPGEGLLACTDGVTEAGAPEFGQALLDAFLLADPTGPGLVGRLFDALRSHVSAGWPADDSTAFWLERSAAILGTTSRTSGGTSSGGTP
jgi:hypothetical protein